MQTHVVIAIGAIKVIDQRGEEACDFARTHYFRDSAPSCPALCEAELVARSQRSLRQQASGIQGAMLALRELA